MFSQSEISLQLRTPRWRPLADTDCVKWALDVSAEEIEQLVDLGYLIGFDISVSVDEKRSMASHRRALRFLTRSIEHYRLTLGMRRLSLSWPQIMRLILPAGKKTLTAGEFDSALNCDPNHRLNLLRAGELQLPGSRWKFREEDWTRGRNCGPILTCASVEDFLKRRRL